MKLGLNNIRLNRPISSYAKVQAFVSAIIRNKRIFANMKNAGCYLDLGCGWTIKPEYCNLDYCWHPGVDVCWDATHRLPFEDGYVAGIFSEHMLEHIPFVNALALLRECRRVLRAGGILRVIVPDGQLYLSEYAKHLAGEIAQIPYTENDKRDFAIVTPIVSVNRIFRSHGHQFMWDFETLILALLRAGFTNVERRTFGQSRDPKLLQDTPSRQIESLYVEAS